MSALSDSRTQIGSRAAIAIGVALVLAACGGSASSSSSGQAASTPASAPSTSSTSTAQTRTASTTVTRTATATATATTATGTGQCVASDLALSFLGQQGGMGQGVLGFALKNTTAAGCRTGGYPGVEFLGASGQPLATTSSRSTGDFIGPTPVGSIDLGPGQTASFRMVVGHGAASTAGCTTAAGLQVIPPNDTATLHTTIPNGAYECGSAALSPLRPGSSAYP